MSQMRARIAQRLKESQNTAAMLTTFQECDMHELMKMRTEYKDSFMKEHGVKLGFMSCFVKAASNALLKERAVNAFIDGNEIVYKDFVDINVAVATPTGLLTPVLRDCDKMSFADVEREINHLAEKARSGQMTIPD
jgi:2-oxoglutarate dehydrogenase E2 component (dihydrolipoamide succinyltransferase)